jgi:hypothetical protein
MREENKTNSISEATRRNIFDYLRAKRVDWSGRLQETDFLSRLYDLETLPSSDYRCPSMLGDIWQHRVNNPMDWDDDWVYGDERLNLLHCSDEAFLNFLCEMLHPIVRPDADEVSHLLSVFNEVLAAEGWQIVEKGRMANRPVFAARRLIPGSSITLGSVHKITQILSVEYITQQVNRMEAAVESDPELAIGTAKEFVETICKTILAELNETPPKNADLLDLVKQVRAKLKLLPENVPERAKGTKIIKRLLSNLGAVAQGLAELRGLYGTGHGKAAGTSGLQLRHARLAVGAATALGLFLFETYQDRIGRESNQ